MTGAAKTDYEREAERIRKRLPDYFKALEVPWHLAASYLAAFVNDDEEPVGIPGAHARNLFSVARALWMESKTRDARIRAEARREAFEEAAKVIRQRHVALDRQKQLTPFARDTAKHELACVNGSIEGMASRAKAAAQDTPVTQAKEKP